MKKSILISALVLAATSGFAQDASLYVDVFNRGAAIPESMYGVFFEEINHAGDGGLYAEMLQNRSFSEQIIPGGMTYADGKATAVHSKNYYTQDYTDWYVNWDLESKKNTGWRFAQSGCTMTHDVVEPETPLNATNTTALQLTISGSGATSSADVINTGYWGVAAESGKTYRVTFYLSTLDYTGPIHAQLCDNSGNVVGDTTFTPTADGAWNKYTAVITSNATFNSGTFRLRFSGDGTLLLDYVSLFPTDTYKGRENGLRKDVVEALEKLKPDFMRWPGGCVVEGATLGNRVRWKETIGDPETRPGEYVHWGYRASWGMGYHEFLQLCEDMGMDGMYVANVGMACSIRNGDYVTATDYTDLKPYLDDIIDAIEYAIGDPDSNEWAAKRAANGHPEPFPLKYVELGNENTTTRYSDRYAYFYTTLKEMFPQITFICTVAPSWAETGMFSKIAKTDMYDVHWYVKPDEFYDDATLFDNATRGDYKIYAGEYAVADGVGSGNMDAALAEACFIGAMERNSDLITMTSYAPLLTNVNAPCWNTNLIWLDNDQVMGRASYYVQQLYAQNRPDYNVDTHIFSDVQKQTTQGEVGVGTWNTQAKFRNLKVTSHDSTKTFYESDFVNDLDAWTSSKGTWATDEDGNYMSQGSETPAISKINRYSFRNSTLEVEAMKTGGNEGFLIVFGGDTLDASKYYQLNIGGWNNTQAAIEKVSGYNGTVVSKSVPCKIENDRWYKIKVVMQEADSIYCYLDDKLILTYGLQKRLNGRLQAFGGYDKNNQEMVIKVVNATEKPLTTTVNLNASGIQKSGEITTLQASSLSEENTLDNPTKISPATTTYDGFSSEFSYEFPACSFTVMRVKADSTAESSQQVPVFNYSDEPITLYAASQKRKTLTNRLSHLVAYAEDNYNDSVPGAACLTSAITKAKEVLGSSQTITSDIANMETELRDSLVSYFKGIMDVSTEKTDLIENANFSSMSTDGWQGSLASLESNVGEFFNTTFNTWQTLTDLDNGLYLAYVQGFYRAGSQEVAYASHENGTEQLNAVFYAGDKQAPLHSLYKHTCSIGGWNSYCNMRNEAEAAFNTSWDTFANFLLVEVKDGQLKLGLKKETGIDVDWACFNNFRLFQLPATSTGIDQLQTSLSSTDDCYTISGIKVKQPSRHGVYIAGGKKILK